MQLTSLSLLSAFSAIASAQQMFSLAAEYQEVGCKGAIVKGTAFVSGECLIVDKLCSTGSIPVDYCKVRRSSGQPITPENQKYPVITTARVTCDSNSTKMVFYEKFDCQNVFKEFQYVNNDCAASTDKKTAMTCVAQLPPNTIVVTTDQNILAAFLKNSNALVSYDIQWAALVPALLFLVWL